MECRRRALGNLAIKAGEKGQPAEGTVGESILDSLTSHSFGVAFDDNGIAVPTDIQGRCGPIPES